MSPPRRTEERPLALDTPIERLKGLGPKRAAAWQAEGVREVGDLLRWPPRRHVRFESATPIARLVEGTPACIRVTVVRRKGSGRRGVVANRLDVRDESGTIAAIVFGPRWLVRAFARDESLLLRGELRRRGPSADFLVRGWLHEEELPPANEPAWQPHYALPEAIAPRLHRRLLRAALAALAPWPLREACESLHFPRSEEAYRAGRRAFALEAAVTIQRRLLAARQTRPARAKPACLAPGLLAEYLRALPFAPTDDQRRALDEIAADLASPRPMARLLSGDVGSGKSAVAYFPLLAAARAGRQGALLAPTELLARQHHEILSELLPRLGLPPPQLMTSGSDDSGASARRRGDPIEALVVVGTHRLLSAPLRFRDLASIVVDEQHKFGVGQRSRLVAKGGQPDLLLVSATPIPRTLAHALFGHLDLSTLAQRPFSARQVTTELLLGAQRRTLGERLRGEIERGGKAFVVCPAIAAAPSGSDEKRAVASAETIAPWLQKQLGAAGRVALLHGRLDPAAKQQRLAEFACGDVRALVATVVIEVGIDVPDATVAVVLAAERFGLSQLHQIRGRIGRRGHPSRCLIVSADPSDEARTRLEAFARLDDGFALAELDFTLRGPGELLGTRQHGMLPALYPEALLDPTLVTLAKELAKVPEDLRNSAGGKRFRELPVASSHAIW